jgi:hypothetical protein
MFSWPYARHVYTKSVLPTIRAPAFVVAAAAAAGW